MESANENNDEHGVVNVFAEENVSVVQPRDCVKGNNQIQQPSATRKIPFLLSIVNALVNSLMIAWTKEVTIHELMGDNIYSTNLNQNFINLQLMRTITPNKDQTTYVYSIHKNANNNGNSLNISLP